MNEKAGNMSQKIEKKNKKITKGKFQNIKIKSKIKNLLYALISRMNISGKINSNLKIRKKIKPIEKERKLNEKKIIMYKVRETSRTLTVI